MTDDNKIQLGDDRTVERKELIKTIKEQLADSFVTIGEDDLELKASRSNGLTIERDNGEVLVSAEFKITTSKNLHRMPNIVQNFRVGGKHHVDVVCKPEQLGYGGEE